MRYNIQPARKESAIYRRKNDERVEILGSECIIWRRRNLKPTPTSRTRYDAFDDMIISKKTEPAPLHTRVVLEMYYQHDKDITGDDRGREEVEYPIVGTFRFVDKVQKSDLVEIPYEYCMAAGLDKIFNGSVMEPTQDLRMRFKLVNRRTRGIRADFINQFFLAPTEETWIQ